MGDAYRSLWTAGEERSCDQRGATWVVTDKDKAAKKACTARCAALLRGKRQRDARVASGSGSKERGWCPVYFPICRCGRVFCARSRQQKHCSDECGYLAVKAAMADRYAADPGYRERVIAVAQARRATALGLGSKRMLLSALAERDGWVCRLCSQPIDPAATVKGIKPSLDHVVPLSRGGTHDLSNVQLAHYLCNLSKGPRVAPSAAAMLRVRALLAEHTTLAVPALVG
jgi:hypothetical protein